MQYFYTAKQGMASKTFLSKASQKQDCVEADRYRAIHSFEELVNWNICIGKVIFFVMTLVIFRNWYYVTSAVGQPGFVPRNYMKETSATSEEKTSHCQKGWNSKIRTFKWRTIWINHKTCSIFVNFQALVKGIPNFRKVATHFNFG